MSEQLQEHHDVDAQIENEQSNDPVVVLQLMQVREREFKQVLKKLVIERELSRDALNYIIETVMTKSSGLLGLIRVAFKGRKLSKEESGKLDLLVEYEDLLESRIQKMTKYIEFVFDLQGRAETNSDAKNVLVLRQRCISILETEFDSSEIIAKSKKCRPLLKEYQTMILAEREKEQNSQLEKTKKTKKKKASNKKDAKPKLNLEQRVLANT